jgi:hypothetical protein
MAGVTWRREHASGDCPAPRPPASPSIALTGMVAALVAAGVIPVWTGLPHLVALPPLDLVGDLTLLLSRAEHPVLFGAGALASVLGRSLVLAALLGRLDRDGVLLALRWYACLWVPSLLVAVLAYASHAVLFYALFWFGLVGALLVLGVTGAVPWRTEGGTLRDGIREAWTERLRLGTTGCYVAGLLALGWFASIGTGAALLTLPVSAAWTWTAVWGLRSPSRAVAVRRSVAGATAVALAVVAWIAATGPDGPPEARPGAASREGSILLMSGIDSASGRGAVLELDPMALGYECEQTWYFSYAGPGAGQPRGDARCPIDHGAPYGPEDTMRGRDELVAHLEDFVAGMPSPAVVVAHSQAAWLAWEAAADGRLGDQAVLVLVGAFPENPVTYRHGELWSPGRLVLEPIAQLPRPGGGTTAFDPDSPLGEEWLSVARPEETFDRSLPQGIEAVAMPSSFDLPLVPSGRGPPGATTLCPTPVIHPNLPYSDALIAAIDRGLGEPAEPGCPWWRTAIGRFPVGFAPPPS